LNKRSSKTRHNAAMKMKFMARNLADQGQPALRRLLAGLGAEWNPMMLCITNTSEAGTSCRMPGMKEIETDLLRIQAGGRSRFSGGEASCHSNNYRVQFAETHVGKRISSWVTGYPRRRELSLKWAA